MSTLVLEPVEAVVSLGLFGGDQLPPQTSTRSEMDGYGRLTLDDLIKGVWEGLAIHRTVPCPVCGGAMMPRSAAPGQPPEGLCTDCGAGLS